MFLRDYSKSWEPKRASEAGEERESLERYTKCEARLGRDGSPSEAYHQLPS